MNPYNNESNIISNKFKTSYNQIISKKSISETSNNTYSNIKPKSREDSTPIERIEFIFENYNQNTQNKKYLKHYYKTKIQKTKKSIKNNIKNNIQYSNDIKSFSVKKKYLKEKLPQDNINDTQHKISPYNFKYFYKVENRKPLHKSQSNMTFNNKESNNMESNFMKLSKEANIYTSNAKYIKNKKMLLFEKFNYDNNEYKPDRAKLFDMTRIPNFHNKNSFIYKTINFRAGHLIQSNSASITPKTKVLNNSSLLDINNSNNNLYEKCLQFRNFSNTIVPSTYLDNSFQNTKRHPPSDTLYKELMSKKNETYEHYFENHINKEKGKVKINENEKNEIKNEGKLYTFYKSLDNKAKITNISDLKKLYYKQIINNNDDLNGYSPLLSKKKNDWGQPISFPKIFSSNIVFDNRSQKERYEKISESFYNLKGLIDEYKKNGKLNDLDFIYEYCLNKNVDKKYLNIKNLNNFYNFLKEETFPLDLTKSMKENILLALEFDKNKQKQNNAEHKNIFMKKINPRELIQKQYKNKNNSEHRRGLPLMIDLERQSKMNNRENFIMSDRISVRNELKKELDEIKNEVLNKQQIIQNIQNENLERRSNNNNNINGIIEYKSQDDKNKEKGQKIINEKLKEKLFDSNERLYYTWYKNKNSNDLKNFIKKSKLTELYFYNRTKEKMKQEDLEQKFFNFNKKKKEEVKKNNKK